MTRSKLMAGRAARAIAAVLLAGAAIPAGAAGTYLLAASATVISKSSCRFSSPNGLMMGFGSIDPSSSVNATASVNMTIVCNGSASTAFYAISSDDGLHSTGPHAPRMRHATNPAAFLPYSLNVPLGGTTPKGISTIVPINGTITPAQFGDAIAGNYADTVTLTIIP
jgi:spore coat protein U-like protein